MSLQREHFQQLQQHRYLVSRKLDGDRTQLLIHRGRLWILLRNFQVFRSHWFQEFLRWESTLLDSEWIQTSSSSCVIDCLVCRGDPRTMQYPILRRLHECRRLLPLISRLILNGGSVHVQRYYALQDLRFLMQSKPLDDSATDGIVFTPQSLPYHPGRDNDMFKSVLSTYRRS